MTAYKVISDRFKASGPLAQRLGDTTAELFALWRAIGETSDDPAIRLKLGAEPRFERYQPTAIAAVCSRTFRDALQRIARYKKLTCPEEIRVRTSGDEASVEFIYLQAEEVQPNVMVDLVLSWILAIGRRGTFFRAFHRWEGTSPREWRTPHRPTEAVALACARL